MEQDRLEFWSKYTDRQILEAIQKYLYKQYGFKQEASLQIENDFMKHLYFATHVLEFLIDEGWEEFEKSAWNTPDFYTAIGFFNGRFLDSMKQRMAQYEPGIDDSVQEYAIETQSRLQEHISEAIRLHRAHFDSILGQLQPLIEENIKRRDAIYREKWKA
ncbi:MAG TPA: hypothetical protein PKW08_08085 [Flavobacteriaceae bacterium]|nr:hypothetical protein [Flavobacteriaceae bacterium]MCB9213530.1 hypothetical protein [Alteromonas sp.]HPF10756.1 hypothetical protein [Flavobacteriaceae bacterium]HQU21536.1 hypothetical protein [Flavobacteriaceae bacterium]HQU65505.1 hypothetical protein [Flavobacteriaceae bacterium]